MRGCGCGGAASASTQLSNVLSGSPSGPGRRGGLSVLAAKGQLRLCGGLLAFWQRRPANPFLRSAFDPFFCFRGVFELSASSVFLPSSRCNTAHRVRRHVKQLVRGNAMSASHQATVVPVSGRFGGYFNSIRCLGLRSLSSLAPAAIGSADDCGLQRSGLRALPECALCVVCKTR